MTNALAEIGKEWDKAVAPVLYAQTIGRKLIPMNTGLSHKGIGMTEVAGYNYAERAAAVIDYDIVEDNLIADGIDVTVSTLKIPVQQDDAVIKRRTWEAMVRTGVTIQADLSKDMAALIAAQEDAMIINGWIADGTNYEIKGMFQVANNSAAGADFATYGNALASVSAALDALWTDNIYSEGYNLILHPTQYGELIGSYSTAGIWEYTQVLEQLNINAPAKPGKVFMSTNIPATNGLVAPVASPANSRYFDLIEAFAPTHDLWIEGSQKTGPIHVRLVGAVVPRFKHLSNGADNCICKITGI